MLETVLELGFFKVFRYHMVAGDQLIHKVKDPIRNKARAKQPAEQVVTRGQLKTIIRGPILQPGGTVAPFEYTSTIREKTAIVEYRPDQIWAGPIQVIQVAETDTEYICVMAKTPSLHRVSFRFETAESFNISKDSLIIPMNDCSFNNTIVPAFDAKLIEYAGVITASQPTKIAVFNIV